MEEMPITLDDGDFWLPSDIFPPDDELYSFSSRVASVDDLSRQLSSLSAFDRSPYVIPRPERFGRVGVRLGPKGVTATSPYGSYALTMGPTVDQAFPNFARPGPGFTLPNNPILRRYDVVQPVQPQVVGQLMESEIATRTSNRRGHRHDQTRSMGSPFAFQENRFGFNYDSCGLTFGTGVFIPRATPSSSFHRKKPSGMASHGMIPKTVGLGRGKEYYEHHQITSSEMGLPKDWTY